MIVDVNTYMGHWPFRRIRFSGTEGILSLMDRTGTEISLVTPLNSVFYKDCLEGLKEMLEDTDGESSRLCYLSVINPNFPGWEWDFALSVDKLGALGLRLFPNYHGYRLDDPASRSLLGQAGERKLPVMITFRIQDERSHHWLVKVPPVPVEDVDRVLRDFPNLKVILSNVLWNEVEELGELILASSNVFIEISYFKGPMFVVEKLVDRFGAGRILYGSAAPLQYPESTLLRVTEAEISDEDKERILGQNAMELFHLDRSGK